MSEEIKAYNTTRNAIEDIQTECGNFGNFEWCKEYGCEDLQACKDIPQVIPPSAFVRGERDE